MIYDLAQIGLAGIGILALCFAAWIGFLILFWAAVFVYAGLKGMTDSATEAFQKRHDQFLEWWERWVGV